MLVGWRVVNEGRSGPRVGNNAVVEMIPQMAVRDWSTANNSTQTKTFSHSCPSFPKASSLILCSFSAPPLRTPNPRCYLVTFEATSDGRLMNMAEQGQLQQLPEAPFPAPPPFWKHFTVANEEQLKKLESLDDPVRPKLPLHLTYLRPPPAPPSSAEHYTVFGQSQVIDPTKPSSLPRDQLLFNPDGSTLNHAVLLSGLTKSLLLNFLELTSILSLDPTKHEEKMEDIRQLVLNIHVVINMYRPHQARESVKEMLERILEDGQREMDECDRLKQRVEDFLGEVGSLSAQMAPNTSAQDNGTSSSLGSVDGKMVEQRRMWKMIHEMSDS